MMGLWWQAMSLGGLVGLTLGLAGAGGGILAMPLLVLGLGLPLAQAAPTALVAVGVAAAAGALAGWLQRRVRYRAAALIGGLGLCSAPGGVAMAARLPETPLLLLFAALLAWVALRMWRSVAHGARPGGTSGLTGTVAVAPAPIRTLQPCVLDPSDGRLRWTRPCAWRLAGTGVLSGLLSGLLGVGGGFVIVPSLSRDTDLDMPSIVATSLAVIALVSLGGAGIAAAQGRLDAAVTLPFATGATVVMWPLSWVAARLDPRWLRRGFTLVALLAAGMMVSHALTPATAPTVSVGPVPRSAPGGIGLDRREGFVAPRLALELPGHVHADQVTERVDGLVGDRVEHAGAAGLAADEAVLREAVEVPGHVGRAAVAELGQFAHAAGLGAQQVQDLQPRRLGQGLEPGRDVGQRFGAQVGHGGIGGGRRWRGLRLGRQVGRIHGRSSLPAWNRLGHDTRH